MAAAEEAVVVVSEVLAAEGDSPVVVVGRVGSTRPVASKSVVPQKWTWLKDGNES